MIKRIPSPLKVYASMRRGLASYSYFSRGNKPSQRLSSVEQLSNGDIAALDKMGTAREREHGLINLDEMEMVHFAGIREVV